MNYQTCPVYDCCGGTIIRDNGMRARCRNCDGRGVVEAPSVDVRVVSAGPAVVTPALGQHVIVLDGLTDDEVRVITGLVRAMREHRLPLREPTSFWSLRAAEECLRAGGAACLRQSWSDATFTAAWHIAHAISQMGES